MGITKWNIEEDEYVQRSERRGLKFFKKKCSSYFCMSYYLPHLLDGEFMSPGPDLLGLRLYFKCLAQSLAQSRYSVY